MPELSLMFFAVAVPAVIFAGISKAGFGSGVSFAAASILALILDPGQALALMLPLLMLIDLATLRPFWNRWNTRDAYLLIAGGVPGVALGAWLYRFADADLLRLLIGCISIGFVLWHVAQAAGARRKPVRRLPNWMGVSAGVITGFTSFISHAGGPPAAVYLLSRKLGKTEYQATTVLVFWVVNVAKFIPYAYLGMFTYETAMAGFLLSPFALLGTWIGVRAHLAVSERLFFGLAYVLLIVTGSKLIWDALT
ncbi:MAG: sulfite exporter TauE/SafE family protein [Pseudomonadota bacterium]